ncbi:hypothetical protein [Crenobacter cavernae]|uniref:MipA/OmpV family protein n=1 Tax=Crenobacter cavernae TaxID=2290923 RepID=A0A345Y3U7_9NEIS|nr:hypothetical protein [Crenobacter cavernae]AXK38599.1 hypothetical protein DWG20_03690 [Crenobacter cavernae]
MSSFVALADSSQPIVKVGLEGYQEKYEETLDGSRFMEEKARMLGVSGAIRFDLSEKDALSLEGRWGWGDADYSSASSEHSGLGRSTYDLRLVYQHDFDVGQQRIIPEIGLGRRRLEDKLQEAGLGGYQRESTYQYATLGLRSVHALGSEWKVEPKLSYNYLLKGKQVSRLSDINPAAEDLKNNQKHGYGFELSASFVRELEERKAVSITPFWRAWRIDDSDTQPIRVSGIVIGSGMEPKNKTDEIGVNVSYHF